MATTNIGGAAKVAPHDLETRLLALAKLDLQGLREEWASLWGAPPKLRSPDLLRRMMAWRLQTEVFGGLTSPLRRKLRAPGACRPTGALTPGCRLSREWRGSKIEVVVTADGFVHEARTYASLSEIARAVTGTRWSGPRFFGLTKEEI